MIRFALQFILTSLGVTFTIFLISAWLDTAVLQDLPSLMLKMAALPGCVATLTVVVIDTVSPRRLFHPAARREAARHVAGAASAGLTWAIAIPVLALTVNRLTDTGAVASSAAIATALIIVMTARLRTGHCHQCGYDLGATTTNTCPECGERTISAERCATGDEVSSAVA